MKDRKTKLFLKKDKSGQLFSLDAVTSIVVFMIILIFILALWNIYSYRLQENLFNEEMQLLAFQITDILTKSEGEPNDWENNPTEAEVIGLSLTPGRLDSGKLNAFMDLDYSLLKEKFNLENYEFSFEIFDTKGRKVDSIGLSPDNSSLQTIAVSNLALIDKQPRELIFTLWRK